MPNGLVEKITNGGWGLVRSDEGVVFLNNVLPQEEVSYRIRERARGILWGETLKILSPSPHRIIPPCKYYGECGGCVFQHIDYLHQESLKKNILMDDLKRIGHYEGTIQNYFPSPPFQYRIRAKMKGHDSGKTGFIRKGTNTVIPINHCLLFPEEINQFLDKWNTLPAPPFFHQLDILFNPSTQALYVHLSHPPKSEKEILKLFPEVTFSWSGNENAAVSRIIVGNYSYYISPTAFFQVNRYQWANMLARVEAYLQPCDRMIDLYSGVGFFIPLLRKYGKTVIGVESFGLSVSLAQKAFPGIEFHRVPAEKFSFPQADVLILDPPRSGLSSYVRGNILNQKYKKIIYISCASAAFSRDMAILRDTGYTLNHLDAFDLFPQTQHLETMGLFTL